MQRGKSYIKDSSDFVKKFENLQNVPEGGILVMEDVVGPYPSIPHEVGLNVLRKPQIIKKIKTFPQIIY